MSNSKSFNYLDQVNPYQGRAVFSNEQVFKAKENDVTIS